MLHKTKGIVLHQIDYSETSIIVYVYTEVFGRQTYIIKGVRSKRSSIRANIFQPLFLVEMEVYNHPKREMQNVKEVKNHPPFITLPYDITKSTIALFLAEVLYRSLREEESDSNLFEFLSSSIQLLDRSTTGTANFHLMFMMKLTRFLGFKPSGVYSPETSVFDLLEGTFVAIPPLHPFYANAKVSEKLYELLIKPFSDMNQLNLNQDSRNLLLQHIVDYYKIHMEGIKEIKSLEILRTIFS